MLLILLLSSCGWGPEPGFPNSLGRAPMRGWRSWQAVGGEVDQAVMERAMRGLAAARSQGGGASLADIGLCEEE